jgi:hypothetical protein
MGPGDRRCVSRQCLHFVSVPELPVGGSHPSARPRMVTTRAVTSNGDGLREMRAGSPVSNWFLPSTTATALQRDIPKTTGPVAQRVLWRHQALMQTVPRSRRECAVPATVSLKQRLRTKTSGTIFTPAARPHQSSPVGPPDHEAIDYQKRHEAQAHVLTSNIQRQSGERHQGQVTPSQQQIPTTTR